VLMAAQPSRLDGNQYRIIVESAPNMIWRSGKDALCDFFNATWLAFTGRTMEQELGNGWAEGVHTEDIDRCLHIYLDAFGKREPFEMVYRLRRHDGEFRWIHDKGVPFCDDAGEFAGYIGSCLDVTEQVTGETWKSMAQKDGLTGVWNRQFFDQRSRQLFEASSRGRKKLCAVMFDIDGFKYVNDRYGHQLGDKVLVAFAGVLKANIRDKDLLGRFGGDEFILFLPDTGAPRAEAIIRRISDKLSSPFSFDGNGSIVLSFSHGIAEMKDGDTFDAFIGRADQAMYAEKKRKKQG